MTMIVSALLSLFFASPAVAQASDALPHQQSPSVQQSKDPTTASEKPDNAEAITRLLSARHPEDMPADSVWEARPNAAAALQWIVIHGPLNLHRARALSILRHYPDPSTKDLLLKHVEEVGYHPLIRSGAAHGLMGQTLDDAACARIEELDGGDSERLQTALQKLIVQRCTK